LANFAALRELEQGLTVICAAPHSRLQPTIANIKAAKLKGRLPLARPTRFRFQSRSQTVNGLISLFGVSIQKPNG